MHTACKLVFSGNTVTMADCVYRLNENKTTIQQRYYFEIHHCISRKSKHMPKNHNPEDSYSANILFTSFTTGSQSVQHQLQLNASSPLILITSPKLPVSFNLPPYFNRQRGADGEGYVKRRVRHWKVKPVKQVYLHR